MDKKNKETIINRIRLAIAGLQKHFAGAKTIVLDGTPTKPNDAIATLEAAITSIDDATTAETAFHGAVATQNAAIASATATLANVKTLAVFTFGKKGAALADFGMAPATRKIPDAATKALAVERRAATRVARGTKGPKAKLAITGTVPATPAAPTKTS